MRQDIVGGREIRGVSLLQQLPGGLLAEEPNDGRDRSYSYSDIRHRAAGLHAQNRTSARAEVLTKARQQLASGRSADEVLEFLAHTLTNRLLHPPTAALREAALSGDAELARAADRLFPAQAPYTHLKKEDDADPAP